MIFVDPFKNFREELEKKEEQEKINKEKLLNKDKNVKIFISKQ